MTHSSMALSKNTQSSTSIITLSKNDQHHTQLNDTLYNDTHHNDTKQNDTGCWMLVMLSVASKPNVLRVIIPSVGLANSIIAVNYSLKCFLTLGLN
jgi:hypothetical protein